MITKLEDIWMFIDDKLRETEAWLDNTVNASHDDKSRQYGKLEAYSTIKSYVESLAI